MISKYSNGIVFSILFLLTSCSFISEKKESEKGTKDEFDIVLFYLNKYGDEMSVSECLNDSNYIIHKIEIKGITGTQADSVFVMPALSSLDKADSYYFCNIDIPRLETDSYCCQPENLNTIEDIDEDGINEVVIFYSSCSSRYKSLQVFSLKDNNWIQIGSSEFDILTKDLEEVTLSELVRKIKKNEFEMCNFFDNETFWTKINLNHKTEL